MFHIELIIFDVDGTLYDLDDTVRSNYDTQLEFFSHEMNITREKAVSIFEQKSILPYKSPNAKSATEFFLQSGINIIKWKNYREAHFSPEVIDRTKAVNETLIKSFAGISELVILSSNTLGNILSVLQWININPALFKDIYCADRNTGKYPFSKNNAMRDIIADTKADPEKILSVGDRYSTDIEPMLKLGGHGILISGPECLQCIYDDLSEGIITEKNYHYY